MHSENIQIKYLENLNDYNNTVLEINYLNNWNEHNNQHLLAVHKIHFIFFAEFVAGLFLRH